jgi:hypothetical protein
MPLATTVVSLFVVARYGVMLYVVGVIVFPLTGLNPVLMSFGALTSEPATCSSRLCC